MSVAEAAMVTETGANSAICKSPNDVNPFNVAEVAVAVGAKFPLHEVPSYACNFTFDKFTPEATSDERYFKFTL